MFRADDRDAGMGRGWLEGEAVMMIRDVPKRGEPHQNTWVCPVDVDQPTALKFVSVFWHGCCVLLSDGSGIGLKSMADPLNTLDWGRVALSCAARGLSGFLADQHLTRSAGFWFHEALLHQTEEEHLSTKRKACGTAVKKSASLLNRHPTSCTSTHRSSPTVYICSSHPPPSAATWPTCSAPQHLPRCPRASAMSVALPDTPALPHRDP